MGSLTSSEVSCYPTNGVTARPGETIDCTLFAAASGENVDFVTADSTVPPHTTFNAADLVNFGITWDPAQPTKLHVDASQLGLLIPGFRKQVTARLTVATDGTASPGDPVQMSWTVHGNNAPDATVTSNVVNVSPLLAALVPSTMACVDDNAGALLPNDIVSCTVQLTNIPKAEAASGINVNVMLPANTTWESGGNESYHSGTQLIWLPTFFSSGIASGTTFATPLSFRFRVGSSMLGGTSLTPTAFATFTSSPSGVPGFRAISAQLVTTPGPALLTGSSLACADNDPPTLLPGDTIGCRLMVINLPGREDLQSATATGPVPAGTILSTGQLDSGGNIVFGTDTLGDLPSGTTKAVGFQLHVLADTPAGTTITPTMVVNGTSVPSNTAISVPLTATPLTVQSRTPAPVAAVAAPAATVTPVKAPKICASRRVVVVNVRPPRGRHWKSVTIAFSTKTVKAKRVKGKIGYFRARLVFQGLPKGPLTIRITGRTTSGKTVHRTRTYHLCVPRAA